MVINLPWHAHSLSNGKKMMVTKGFIMFMHILKDLPLRSLLSTSLIVLALTGCNEASIEQNDTLVTKQSSLAIDPSTVQETAAKQSPVTFATTVAGKRRGFWKGGAAPVNKQQSNINTYYKIKASKTTENTLTMTMRFEGITADDALVEFHLLDGARFVNIDQRTQWRLKPNVASEVSFEVVVPTDKPSYLALSTMQNNLGASRAFVLAATY